MSALGHRRGMVEDIPFMRALPWSSPFYMLFYVYCTELYALSKDLNKVLAPSRNTMSKQSTAILGLFTNRTTRPSWKPNIKYLCDKEGYALSDWKWTRCKHWDYQGNHQSWSHVFIILQMTMVMKIDDAKIDDTCMVEDNARMKRDWWRFIKLGFVVCRSFENFTF